eukprot:TRINITY_DN40819_c0_g1_i1.p1 TRINITY_DN40819_c0_g1~~TRINITY_DN40819_c0_g1_i1.p1  ORF type:complete len:525 (+),score=81.00 TRINITY_DN40819_c0_g1_i1:108-1577(+)
MSCFSPIGNVADASKQVVANGIREKPEISALEIHEDNVAPFSMPQEALSFEPRDEDIICRFSNGDCERKIHCNIQLLPHELEALKLLQEQAQKEGISLSPSVSVAATRFLSHARGDFRSALKMMEETQTWRLSCFQQPLTDALMAEDLQHGIVYFAGRDKALRPVLVFRAARIPQAWHRERSYHRVIQLCCFCMEYFLRYMVVPGRIESINLMIDLKNLSLSQIPVGVLREVHTSMGTHYVGRVARFYICNMPRILGYLLPLAMKVLTDRQREKLVFVSRSQDLSQHTLLRQVEEDLGGTRPVLKEFFPFPLLSGPFSEDEMTEIMDPVRNVHKVFTATGVRGHLPSLAGTKSQDDSSSTKNTSLDFSSDAAEIFQRCNLPVPADLLAAEETADDSISEADLNTEATSSSLETSETCVRALQDKCDSRSIPELSPLEHHKDLCRTSSDSTLSWSHKSHSSSGCSNLKSVEVIKRKSCCFFSQFKAGRLQ